MTPPLNVTLFATSACHLCEEAASLLKPLAGNGVQVHEVDIIDSQTLLERYQLRIPVLKRDDNGAELDWPFDMQQLIVWLGDVIGEEG
ncbi:MAG TPA: glutaredoxin family protein [Pseudomonas xinjiangensis]|uniref:Glutaredoxin family protein n=2 Tax=root TaxID=1 RepID=A0A7V1FR47_9GAMM|nr:glutaredoxin family protein [Halopseudomonas xinjiangensis]HEC47808.1 glutaredoxin family protein [Halopseudomonas xinjiangensis]